MMKGSTIYPVPIRALLLKLARKTIEQATANGTLPWVDPQNLPRQLHEPKATFVTLHKDNRLRGCIGHLEAQMPLYKSVMENARSAALYDVRFNPVTPEEVRQLVIEISILSPLQKLQLTDPDQLLSMLEPGRHGVVLQRGTNRATFLPQVWEQLPDPQQFLSHLSMKAGLAPNAWRDRSTQFWVYEVEKFSETDPEIVAYFSQCDSTF